MLQPTITLKNETTSQGIAASLFDTLHVTTLKFAPALTVPALVDASSGLDLAHGELTIKGGSGATMALWLKLGTLGGCSTTGRSPTQLYQPINLRVISSIPTQPITVVCQGILNASLGACAFFTLSSGAQQFHRTLTQNETANLSISVSSNAIVSIGGSLFGDPSIRGVVGARLDLVIGAT